MLANASFLVTDPKGECVRAVGPLLLKRGYVLRVFDLVDLSRSDCYNPFRYIRKDADVFRLIDNLIQNTTPEKRPAERPVLAEVRDCPGQRPSCSICSTRPRRRNRPWK